MKRIAIVVGHKLTAQGAVNYLDKTEFEFNSRVAKLVKVNFEENQLDVFYKDDLYIEKIIEFNPDVILELHFNSFFKKVYGSEAIVLESNTEAFKEASNFQKALNHVLR